MSHTPAYHLAVTCGIFCALYTVSVSREFIRQRRLCKCKPAMWQVCVAAIGEAVYAFSGETILYYLTLN